MFSDIPRNYDLINRLVTLGMDRGWKLKLAKKCLSGHKEKILDLCCGTGDLSIGLAKLASPDSQITGLDFSSEMMDVAKARAKKLGCKVEFVLGDAAKMPFTDAFFDCIGNSFGFRNLTYQNQNAKKHVSEILRVLKPGGRLLIAESSQPKSRLIRFFNHLYLRTYVFWIGWLVSGNKGAYKYLSESCRKYYSPLELENLLLSSGFSKVVYTPFFYGAAGLYEVWK
jgi:demethylmenaquinone methyltransferase/2-methoxy-6-polyprenyl-1,4-benzoquinol methylase